MPKIDEFGLHIMSPLAVPSASNFRPPSWPPPEDWAPIVDANGKPICLYKDSVWPLRAWGDKPRQLNFGDGSKVKTTRIDKENANILRLLMTWRIWGPRGARSVGSIKNFYDPIRSIVAMCSQEGIIASDLMHFPTVVDKIPRSISPSKYSYAITVLHDILDAQEFLGFTLLDQSGIARLAQAKPNHKKEQTPFIPPRIWIYQVNRLRQFIDEFEQHREKIIDCFNFCCNAYAHNYGTLSLVFSSKRSAVKHPFQNSDHTGVTGAKSGYLIHGPFSITEDRFELNYLFDRWLGKDHGKRKLGVSRISKYLSLASLVGLKYVLNFTMMRINEGWNLRADCIIKEIDEKLGTIYLICGETTKTDSDSDARWPTSPSAKLGVEVMATVARLRMRCAKSNPFLSLSAEDIANPYLLGPLHEPWSSDGGRGKTSKKERPSYQSYADCVANFPLLFDPNELKIREIDLQLARSIEPSLNENIFKVGEIWPFAYHQLRRTGAINMLSSGMVSEPTLQHQLKHAARAMSMYYGHNFTRLNLDNETRNLYLTTMYKTLANELAYLVSPQFISPHGDARKEQIVSFISLANAKTLETAGRNGAVSARQIRLGFCMKRSTCEYGGIESIAHCGGGDTGVPCTDVLYDRQKNDLNNRYGLDLDRRLTSTTPGTPRHNSLLAEKNPWRTSVQLPAEEHKSAEDRFRLAFDRLKNGDPRVLKHGTQVSQNNVAKEAECDPSALRKSRYPELINEIQAYVSAHMGESPNSERQEILKKRSKNRTAKQAKKASDQQRDQLASQLLCANAMIIELSQKLTDAQTKLDRLSPPADRLIFPNQPKAKPRSTPHAVRNE